MTTGTTVTKEFYLQHHLAHWTMDVPAPIGQGVWSLNVDTLAVSIILGALFLFFFRWAAVRATAATPGALQNFVEVMIEFVDGTVKEIFHGRNALIAPLGLTLFVWIFLMNLMDLIPVDLLPRGLELAGVEHFKAVPTADPMGTFGLAIPVFLLTLFYNFKIKGFVGLGKEMLTKPFGPWLFFLNVPFRILEEVVRPVSLALRLFGNLFAGELIFYSVGFIALVFTMGARFNLGHFPYFNYYYPSIYFYDVDCYLFELGARNTLGSLRS